MGGRTIRYKVHANQLNGLKTKKKIAATQITADIS